jgi:hypothetical protein
MAKSSTSAAASGGGIDRMQSMTRAVLISAAIFLWTFSSTAKEEKSQAGTSRHPNILLVIAVYWLYSINSTLNIGFRHILPTVPLLYMLAVLSIKKWTPARLPDAAQPSKKPLLRMLQAGLIGAMGVWLAAESIAAFPYYLSYFNEYGGGIWNGYRYITDSNLDWGQDLKRLAQFADARGIRHIHVDYFGGADPAFYLKDKYLNLSGCAPPQKGWVAVSAFAYQWWLQKPECDYRRWLPMDKLVTKIGYSIFVFHLD